ncbi:MAG TPA: substrate-binding domain-containing protein [Nocardioidaceae bacterium]|nr:substrate-binding domain-containing protein [Nocardioidaceae bacterium]
MQRNRVLGTLAVVSLIALTACGGNTEGGSSSGEDAIKIGFSQVTQQSPFYVELGEGAKAAAEEAGHELIFVDANGDVTKQNNDVQDLVTRGIDVLVINPVDPLGVAPSLAAAEASGIEVVTVDRPVESGAAAHVGRDNVEMGRLVGEELVTELGDSGGKVIEIQGDAGGAVARDRSEGFHESVEAAGNFEIVEGPFANYIRSEAVTAMQDLLQSNSDVVAVYAHNDDMALGAMQVLNESDRDDVLVFGVDGLMEAVTAIADGDQYVATAFNDPQALGAATIDTAVKLANGEDVPEYVDAGTGLISDENAESLTGDNLFAPQP